MSTPITLIRPDGLYIKPQATLLQLAEEEIVGQFAGGLIPTGLGQAILPVERLTLAEALYDTGPEVNGLLLALLVLDAEVRMIAGDETRIFPMPAFLNYRARLSPDRFPPNLLRLPPLNPDGHYRLGAAANEAGWAVRLDLHPELRLAGHVRIAISSPHHPPQRLTATEHRLDRQVLESALIEAAITAGSAELSRPLTGDIRLRLLGVLQDFAQ